MLTGYTPANGTLAKVAVNQYADFKPDMVWLDLTNPTEQERQWIKQAYAQELQFMEELGEIEASARFYRDEFGLHLNQYFLVTDYVVTRNVNVAFTLNKDRLFTLHSEELATIRAFVTQAGKNAGVLRRTGGHHARHRADPHRPAGRSLRAGAERSRAHQPGDLPRRCARHAARARIADPHRGHQRQGAPGPASKTSAPTPTSLRSAEFAAHVETINEIVRDVDSLTTHSGFLADRAKFLMDAAMGMINISFNRRLNIFTVLSVVLMPPTLIASIYGMNFRHMPELEWYYGYPLALVLMVAVAIGPILYLKSKDWL